MRTGLRLAVSPLSEPWSHRAEMYWELDRQPSTLTGLSASSQADVQRRTHRQIGEKRKFVRVQRIVSVYFRVQLRDARPSLGEAPLAVLLSDTQELFLLLLIFPSNTYLLAFV